MPPASRLKSLACLVALVMPVLGFAADALPPAKAGPTRPINITKDGPPIPITPPTESAHPASIPLWLNGAPGSEARKSEPEDVSWRQESDLVFPVISNVHNPSITPFIPIKEMSNGCAVIIAPGGGHMQHTIDREGYDLAKWFAERGIAAFVLKYRLARDGSNPEGKPQPYTVERDALADGLRAIKLVRSRAAEWNLNPARIGILGFSAGGEVAVLTALRFDTGKPDATDPIDRQTSRPDFFAPIYPGGLNGHDAEIAKDKTPPAFLLCAYDDNMPERLAAFFVTLRKAGVNAELHVYNSGGHGFGVRQRPLAVTGWPDRFVEWLGDRGFTKR